MSEDQQNQETEVEGHKLAGMTDEPMDDGDEVEAHMRADQRSDARSDARAD